jgi:hypothetical protein
LLFEPYFLLNEQPSVRRAFPPVGWQRTVAQEPQMTTVWACEKTVVILKHPGHLTSIKKERGAGTRVYRRLAISIEPGAEISPRTYLELVLASLSDRSGVEEIFSENLQTRVELAKKTSHYKLLDKTPNRMPEGGKSSTATPNI